MTTNGLTRAARGLFDKIADTFTKNNDPLATSGRQNTLANAYEYHLKYFNCTYT